MRIERIRVDAFGRLANFDTGEDALGGLVVVVGPNEAGKSTLFSFLTTALYGFHPASRERNPHVPWGAEEASGRIRLTLGGGGCVEVERRLKSSPVGKLTEGGVTKELRNQPLPWVEHVPRAVFRQVFAVTLADLAGLDDETWMHIQDRIIGSMGSADMCSARAVAETLEREAAEIWRPNRRGNQRLRRVQEEIRALRTRQLGALERDREIRVLVEEREKVQLRLRELRADRQQDRVAVERVQSLLPLRRQMARIASLREKGGARDELRRLPVDPGAELSEVGGSQKRLSLRLASLERELRDAEAIVARFDNGVRGLLEKGEEITRFLAVAAGVAPDRRRADELRTEIAEIRLELEAAGDDLLTEGWSDALADSVVAVSVALLTDRIERNRTRDAAPSPRPGPAGRARAGTVALGPPSSAPGAFFFGAAVAGVTGVVLLSWGFLGGPPLALAVGAALGTAGSIGGVLLARSRVATATGRSRPSSDPKNGLHAEVGAQEIATTVRDIPVRSEYLYPPGDPLVFGLERLQELIRAWRDRSRALRIAEDRVASADEAAQQLVSSLERNGDPEVEGLAPTLDRELRDAERIRDAALSAERERRRLTGERETCQEEVERITKRLSSLDEALRAIGAGDSVRGAEAAKARIEAHSRADQLADELERGHPDLAELTAQIEAAERDGESWTTDDIDLARRRARIEELDAHIEQLIVDAEALDGNAAHLRELETVDAVDGEIANLQEKEARLVQERDRKWILAQLVREADRRFREEHQPDLIRRASSHLAHLTGGRYDRLLVDETRADGLFQLMGPGLPAPIPLAPPVSTGTLEQAYLSLRLAIVDHLDQGSERLPLFIDEALVNWDLERRDRGLDVLADLSSSRQLFVFTCHPAMAERLEGRGGRVLRFEGDT